MLILVPFIIIVLIIFAIDAFYFSDVQEAKEPTKKSIEKTDNRKNYINKYLKK